jgi:hypothetical protein
MATPPNQEAVGTATAKNGIWRFRGVVFLLFLDVLVSVLLMSPILPWVRRHQEDESNHHHYTLAGSLLDLIILSGCRVGTALIAFAVSFLRGRVRDEYQFAVVHPNGKKKTRDELEEEALQQSFGTWLCRYVNRAAFPSELFCLATTLVAVVKCLVRLNLEIGVLRDAEPVHPIFWVSFLFAGVVSAVEMLQVDAVCLCLGKWGSGAEQPSILRRISSHLSLPLLADDSLAGHNDNSDPEGEASIGAGGQSTAPDDEHAPGDSGIGGDADYKASYSDLLRLCAPDAFLISVAFIFLLLAAMMQIFIPKYTGACVDALEQAYANSGNDDDDNNNDDETINDIPGFMSNVQKLIIVSVLSGFFSGIRGSIFTMVGGRVNVRLRLRLMDSLLTMEQGFFDVTKTGEITSRLSSDTTLVGDQVTLNVNVSMHTIHSHRAQFILLFIDTQS